jgi:hypothetical protein
MRSLSCDRSHTWISLRLDGELSRFEHVLLGAHLTACRDCRHFAADVTWQTESLRAAALEPLARPITIPATRGWRWPALGISTAAVAASIVALAIGFHGPSTPRPADFGPTPVKTAQTTTLAGDMHDMRRGVSAAPSEVPPLRGAPNAGS